MWVTHIHRTYTVHNDRTYKEHRNLEIRKHITTSRSGTKTFYQLWVNGFDIRRRDTIFYAVLFIWPPSRACPHRVQVRLAFASSKSRFSSFASSIQLSNFLQISPKSLRALPVRDVTRTLPPRSVHRGLLWHLWVARQPRVRVNHLHRGLHLTNLMCWAERF